METKEPIIEIVAPEGYEVDNEKSTLERIVFKKKFEGKPRSWKEFCERGFTGEEAYVAVTGATKSKYNKRDHRAEFEVGYVDNMEEAKAFIALMQLRQLRKAWIGDWEPDWERDDTKSVIDSSSDCIRVTNYARASRPLSFPTEEMAYKFLKCFKDLLEQAKILL